jgi:hypothetical protein
VKIFKEKNAMKARMKKLISKKSVPVLVLALSIVLGSALAETASEHVSGSGATILDPSDGLFKGSGNLTIQGENFNASITVSVANLFTSEDGVLQAKGVTHTFDFGDANTFITSGNEIGDPTDTPGLFTLKGLMRITSGTGVFENSSGQLTIRGEMDMSTLPAASFDFEGVISGYGG